MPINIRYAPTKRIPRDAVGLKHAKDVALQVEMLKETDDFQKRVQLAMQSAAVRKAQAMKNAK